MGDIRMARPAESWQFTPWGAAALSSTLTSTWQCHLTFSSGFGQHLMKIQGPFGFFFLVGRLVLFFCSMVCRDPAFPFYRLCEFELRDIPNNLMQCIPGVNNVCFYWCVVFLKGDLSTTGMPDCWQFWPLLSEVILSLWNNNRQWIYREAIKTGFLKPMF